MTALAIAGTVATGGVLAGGIAAITGTALTATATGAIMFGTGIALSPIIGIASTQLSLQTGLGQLDSFEKACEQGPQKEGDVYSKVCDANGKFSYEMFQNSDLQRDINSTDIKTMMCGDKDADIVECGSYQAGVLGTGLVVGGGAFKIGKAIPGVKDLVAGIENGLNKIYQGGYNIGGGISKSIPKIFGFGKTTPTETYSSPYFVRLKPGTNEPLAIDTSKFTSGVPTANGGLRNNHQFWRTWAKEYGSTLSESNIKGILGDKFRAPVVDDV